MVFHSQDSYAPCFFLLQFELILIRCTLAELMPDFRDPVKDVTEISFADKDVLEAVRFSNSDTEGESDAWRQSVQDWLLRVSSVRSALEYLLSAFPCEYCCCPGFISSPTHSIMQWRIRACLKFVLSGECCV